jgi:hypothetical protein
VVNAFVDEDVDLSTYGADEQKQIELELANGDLISFWVEVVVTHRTTLVDLGHDALGGCIYESIDAFQDHRACGRQNREWAANGANACCGSQFRGIVETAIKEARQNLMMLGALSVHVGEVSANGK